MNPIWCSHCDCNVDYACCCSKDCGLHPLRPVELHSSLRTQINHAAVALAGQPTHQETRDDPE